VSDAVKGSPGTADLAEGPASELAQLRNLTVAQAREIAVIRWEIASLLKQNAAAGQITHAKYALVQRFPRFIDRAARVKRRVARMIQGATQPDAQAPVASNKSFAILDSFEVNGPLLIADDSPVAKQVANGVPAASIIRVRPGAGLTRSLPVAQANEPALRGPAANSLAQLMIDNDQLVGSAGTIVVEAGDEISLALLRGRLRRGQSLVLTRSTGTTATAVAELGAQCSSTGNADLYTDLPATWLDPLDTTGKPDPAIVAMTEWPKISVVMVSFNQAQFLEEGLRSVLDQGYHNLEFIVIDGLSTDGSVGILERYRSRISVLVIEKDRGQSDGLNKGSARTTGEIVTWVNSDDLLEPGALFRAAQAFRAHKVDLVAGGCRQIGLTRDHIIVNHHNKLPIGLPVALPLGLLLDLERFWLAGCFFYQPEVFFTRDIWERSGGRLRTDLNYVLDYDLWVRMAAAGATIIHVTDFIACSRTHEQQKTVSGMPYMPEVQRLLREYASRLLPPPG
jgi:Glycosyl transferase family 2